MCCACGANCAHCVDDHRSHTLLLFPLLSLSPPNQLPITRNEHPLSKGKPPGSNREGCRPFVRITWNPQRSRIRSSTRRSDYKADDSSSVPGQMKRHWSSGIEEFQKYTRKDCRLGWTCRNGVLLDDECVAIAEV